MHIAIGTHSPQLIHSSNAQVERKFIVARLDGTLLAIDQHAADERVHLERLLQKTVNKEGHASESVIQTQTLSHSREIDASASEMAAFSRFRGQLQAWGWNVRERGTKVISRL